MNATNVICLINKILIVLNFQKYNIYNRCSYFELFTKQQLITAAMNKNKSDFKNKMYDYIAGSYHN